MPVRPVLEPDPATLWWSRADLLAYVLRRTALGITGVVEKAQPGEITDTQHLRGAGFPMDGLAGAYLRFPGDDQVLPVLGYNPERGIVTHVPGSYTPLPGQRYEIWRWHHPLDVLRMLNDTLRNTYGAAWVVLSEVEGSEDFRGGIGGGEGWVDQTLAQIVASEGADVYCSCVIERLYDGAGAALELRRSGTPVARVEAYGPVREMRLQLRYRAPENEVLTVVALANGSSWELTSWALQDVAAVSFSLPRWLTEASQLRGVYLLRDWERPLAEDVRDGPLPDHAYRIVEQSHDDTARLMLMFERPPGAPVAIYAMRPLREYEDDADVQRLDIELVTAGLAVRLYEALMAMPANLYDRAPWAQAQLQYWQGVLTRRQVRTAERREAVQRGPMRERHYYREPEPWW